MTLPSQQTPAEIRDAGHARANELAQENAELRLALKQCLPLLEGFADGDRCDDGEEPIVQPVLNLVRTLLAKGGK